MKVDIKKEYEVGLRGTSYSKVVEAKTVAEAKAMTMRVLKTRYPSRAINADRDLIARLLRVYRDDRLVGQYKKAQQVFEGRRG